MSRYIKVTKESANNLDNLLASYPENANFFRVSQPKPDGTKRPIVIPNEPFNKWLKDAKRTLRGMRKDWPTFIHGGVRKRSYVSFARPHTSKKTVITLDIRDCFGSIKQNQVKNAFARKLAMPERTAKELSAKLCVDGKIPQGFATSNFLTNLYLNDTLLTIQSKLRSLGAEMTIYTDDIAISGNNLDCAQIIDLVCLELSRAKLAIKKAKVRVMQSHARQIIVGLVVNKGVSITREKRTELFSGVASNSMRQESLDGWLANLNMIDKQLMNKLAAYALTKGYTVKV